MNKFPKWLKTLINLHGRGGGGLDLFFSPETMFIKIFQKFQSNHDYVIIESGFEQNTFAC